MKQKVWRRLIPGFFVLLCFVLSAQTLGQSNLKELAQQIAAGTTDDAVSLEARQDALKKLAEAKQMYLNAGETVDAARVLNRMGRLQLKLNAPQDALASHNQALALLKATPALEVEVDNLNGLGEVYLLLKQNEQLQEVLQRSLRLSEPGYRKGQAEALLTLTDIQNYKNHVIGLQTAQKALALWQSLDDKSGLARAYAQIGRCYMAQNVLPEAIQNYKTALQLWHDLNDASRQAEALIMLGYIEYRKGDWQSSISYLTQAQGLVDEKTAPLRMGQVAAGLAEAFNESGLPEIGLIHYQRALDDYRLTQDPHLIFIGLLGVGVTHFLLENYAEAQNYFEQVLAAAARDSLEAASGHRHFGRVSTATGRYDAALDHFQKALVIYTSDINPQEAAKVLGLIGQVYQQQRKYKLASEYYHRALTTFIALSDRLNQAGIYFALGRLELKQKNYDDAENYLQQSIAVTEDIRRVPTSSDLVTAFSATVHDRYETYIECLMRKHSANPTQGLDVRAFETSELARGRSLAELLRNTQTNLAPGLDPELAMHEKSLRQSLRVKENSKINLLATQYTLEELNALEAELGRLEAEYKQVTDIITTRYPSYAQINRPSGWDLRQIQERVVADDQTVLLEYSLGSEKSYVWAVTRNEFHSYELPAQASINEAAPALYQLLKTVGDGKSDNELKIATRELSQLILTPIAPELNKRRVIVVPDGALNYIPFQIMPASNTSDEPLVATSEIINVPSASILGQLREETARRQTPTKVLAALGDPVFASNYAQREGTTANESVASALPVKNLQVPAFAGTEPEGASVNPATLQPLFYATSELANLRAVAGSG